MDQLRPEFYKKLTMHRHQEDNLRGVEEFRKAMLQDTISFDSAVTPNNESPSYEQGEEQDPFAGIEFEKIKNGFWTWFQALGTKVESKSSMFALIRYPLLLWIGIVLLIELILYFTIRQIVAWWEYLYFWTGTAYDLRQSLRQSSNYEEWKASALELDEFMKKDEWKRKAEFSYYDHDLLIKLTKKLNQYRLQKNTKKVRELLVQAGTKANFGNVEDIRLYTHTYYGTKLVAERFLQEVKKSLDFVGESNEISDYDKYKFFKMAYKNYGRSALCLSGGATIAYYHYGVIKGLLEDDMLPRVITGASAGSMIAALAACHTDDELREIINPDMCALIKPCSEPSWVKFRRFIQSGACFDHVDWALQTQWVTKGDTTFLEAYQRTGKILNISATPCDSYSPSKILNYLTAPNCVIWSAVLASSAIPGVLKPITLMIKQEDGTLVPFYSSGLKWRDGSFKTDLPLEALNTCFDVKYTIVSQVNPHVSVFFYDHRGSVGRPASHRNGQGWRGGFVLASLEHFLKLDLKKWLRVLRDLELLPKLLKMDWSFIWLQKFEGSVTILPKVSFWNYWYILTDPSYNRLSHQIDAGRKSVWPKLHPISNRNQIEKSIHTWLKQLKAIRVKEEGESSDSDSNKKALATNLEVEYSPIYQRSAENAQYMEENLSETTTLEYDEDDNDTDSVDNSI